jgi:alpha-tubulin suppressor-like RCC1 family protein
VADADGLVWGWGGDGWSGLHGNGPGDAPCLPKPIASLGAHRIVDVFAYSTFSMAITDEGHCYSWGAWGEDFHPRLGHADMRGCVPAEFTSSMVHLIDGAVVQPPPDSHLDETEMVLYEPRRIGAFGLRAVRYVCADWTHTLAATDDGSLFTWGLSAAVGHGSDENFDARKSEDCDMTLPTRLPGVCTPRGALLRVPASPSLHTPPSASV